MIYESIYKQSLNASTLQNKEKVNLEQRMSFLLITKLRSTVSNMLLLPFLINVFNAALFILPALKLLSLSLQTIAFKKKVLLRTIEQ